MLDSKEKNQSQVRSTPYSRYAPLLLLVVTLGEPLLSLWGQEFTVATTEEPAAVIVTVES